MGRVVTNAVRTCGPTHLLIFDILSNKICLNETIFKHVAILKDTIVNKINKKN